jgi:hypothetical protein
MGTHWRSLLDKKYLGAWDFPRPGTGTISAVKGVKLEGIAGRIQANKRPIITFAGIEKKLIVNSSIGEAIEKMYGPSIEDWVGKRITLYAAKTQVSGREVDCVRVRPTIPKSGKDDAPIVPQDVDTEMRAKQDEAFRGGDSPPATREPGDDDT